MSPLAFFVLSTLLLLAMLGGAAGILLEARQGTSRSLWQNFAVRDAMLPIAGWGSLFLLDLVVTLMGENRLPVRFKHILGTLAVLLFYYAVLSTLRLIYLSVRRIHARLRHIELRAAARPLPLLRRLAFPTLFVSAVLATLSVCLYDGLSQNFIFIAGVLALLGLLRRRGGMEVSPSC